MTNLFVEVVGRAKVERLGGLVVFEDRAGVSARELAGARHNGLKNPVQIECGTESATDGAQRGQLFHRACELARPGPELAEEPRVLDGDHGLVREGLEQLDLGWRESTGFGALDGDGADGLAIAHDRSRQY